MITVEAGGRVRCCMQREALVNSKPCVVRGIAPTLREEREEWGTQARGRAGELGEAGPPRPMSGLVFVIESQPAVTSSFRSVLEPGVRQ